MAPEPHGAHRDGYPRAVTPYGYLPLIPSILQDRAVSGKFVISAKILQLLLVRIGKLRWPGIASMDRETTKARMARLTRMDGLPDLTILARIPRPNRPTRKDWLRRATLLTMVDRKSRPNRQIGISSMEWLG